MTRFTVAPHFLLALAVLPGTAAAQEAAREIETYVPPKLLARANPHYPSAAAMAGREGWATLSFVVSRDGEVIEAMIEESSGDEQIAQAALDAVMKWRYEPGYRNGEPVEQAMTQVGIVFQLEGATGARGSFIKRYNDIVELVRAGDVVAAAAGIDELERARRFNLYEDAWFWFLKAYYLEVAKSPDVDARIRALERAVGRQVYLDAPLHITGVQQLYVLHAQNGSYRAAIDTFERLRDEKLVRSADNYETVLAEMTPSYDQLLELVHGQNLLVRKAQVGENDYWVGKLLRRSFTLIDVVGDVDVVDIRCGQATARYEFTNPEEVWTVPQSWGSCGVYVKGQPGTTFTFQEYPLGSQPGAAEAVSQPSESP